MARLVRIRVGKRWGWIFEPPATCPAGHPGPAQCWSPCEVCGTACIHWRCHTGDCRKKVRDPDHQHRA